jgi:hypothetical protein
MTARGRSVAVKIEIPRCPRFSNREGRSVVRQPFRSNYNRLEERVVFTLKKIFNIFLFAALFALCASQALAGVVQQSPPYTFFDVYTSGGIDDARAQWIVINNANSSIGEISTTTLKTGANIVNSLSNVYMMDEDSAGNRISADVVKYLFMVIPEDHVSLKVNFEWLNPIEAPDSYTMDVLFNEYEPENPYRNTKLEDNIGLEGLPIRSWILDFRKTRRPEDYETYRGFLTFQQTPRDKPPQSVNIPFVIANVRYGKASQENPLLFRAAMRDSVSGTSGNIVAYDHFTWDLAENFSPPGTRDWVFVPVSKLPIDDNQVNYGLRTDITNYSGLRYALQRQDLATGAPMDPTAWRMDVPPDDKDVSDPYLNLNRLSHIPPGLITTYDYPFNVVRGSTGANPEMRLYSVEQPSAPRDLTLVHPSIFGIELGKEPGSDYNVSGFEYLSSQSFPDKVRAAVSSRTVSMPKLDDSVMSGITSQVFVDSNAINTVAVDAPLPRRMVISDDVDGLLPLHVTLKISKENRFMVSKWEALLTAWRNTGRIKTQFANQFSLYIHYPDGTNLDLFNWLQQKNEFDRAVKIFLDEAQGCVTVNFIVMLMDDDSKDINVVEDVTGTGSYGFIVMKDGKRNEKWDTVFMTAPVGYIEPVPGAGSGNDSDGGGGGGGCGVGVPISALVLLGAAVVVRFRKKGVI